MTERALDIEQTMLSLANEKNAKILMRFFKTGKGQYGEGDSFLGVKNPQTRMVVKEAWKSTTIEDATDLIRNKWHEIRLCGLLILVEHFQRAKKQKDDATMTEIFNKYVSLHKHINNWDLVDLSVYKIVGEYEILHPEVTLIKEWISPDYSLWQQRISMVATWIHIRYDKYDELIRRAEVLLGSKEHLLHKAAGWMLREMYKHDILGKQELSCFLERNAGRIPSTMLSYACEKMGEQERMHWRELNKTRKTNS